VALKCHLLILNFGDLAAQSRQGETASIFSMHKRWKCFAKSPTEIFYAGRAKKDGTNVLLFVPGGQ
jgi:hypothetical protein